MDKQDISRPFQDSLPRIQHRFNTASQPEREIKSPGIIHPVTSPEEHKGPSTNTQSASLI